MELHVQFVLQHPILIPPLPVDVITPLIALVYSRRVMLEIQHAE